MTAAPRAGLSRLGFACVAAVIVFQIACPIVIAAQGSRLASGEFSTQSDPARYRAIVEAPGTPYRDHQVEYPPLALGLFRSLGPGHFDGFRLRLLAVQAFCQALIVFLLFRVWGRRAAWSYLVLSTPMLFVVYTTYDLVGVAFAVSALAFVRRKHPLAGAIGFVLGGFTKLWPVVLVPTLVVKREMRAFVFAAVSGFAGLVAWSVWGGAGAIGQVISYRGARGWQYESVPGSLLRVFSGDRLRVERGAWRIGAPAHLSTVLISVTLIALLASIWWQAWRRPDLADGVAETAAVAAVLVFGTLLSAQFLIWPLAFVAIAFQLEPWAAAVSVLTLVDWILYSPTHPQVLSNEIVILGRNAALIGLLVVAGTELGRAPARMGAWSPARSPEASPTLPAPISSSTPKGA